MTRPKKVSFTTLMTENRKEIIQNEKSLEIINNRIEDKIHATIKTK